MPELPEVETVARELAQQLRGRRARELQIVDRQLLRVPRPERTSGRVIRNVRRLGKRIAIELAAGSATPARRSLFIVVHLRMTGRLLWTPRAPRGYAPRHLRARLCCEGGALLFIDPRRFGELHLLRSLAPVSSRGLDPTDAAFTPAALGALLRASGQQLKAWLLRQDRLVGLGNIYASEILFAARLAPTRTAGTLSAGEIRRLHQATRDVLLAAIDHGGTTVSDFTDTRGAAGEHQDHLAVYGREGEPCPRCTASIQRIVQQQRSTYYCPRCQRSTAVRAGSNGAARARTTFRAVSARRGGGCQPARAKTATKNNLSRATRAEKEMTPWRSAKRCRKR